MEINIHIHFEKKVFSLGRLWLRANSGMESASFEYSDSWLKSPQAFAMDPSTPLTRGGFHTEKGRKIFAFLSDCMPDRWGRTILLRQERRRATKAGETPRTLLEADFLLGVNDIARQGSLQFSMPGAEPSSYLGGQNVPSLQALGRLLAASTRLQKDMESDEDLLLLLDPGSSLGGARPKAAVLDAKGVLWIAKFPGPQDAWDVPLWEYVSLSLAKESGLRVPAFRLEKVDKKNVLLVERFDRAGTERIPFASAMTLLHFQDGDHGSYIEIAEVARQDGSQPEADIKELWARMVFNAMTSNVDDHLRNHGFLRDLNGWRLSPVYDLESSPPPYKPPFQHTTIYPGKSKLHLDEVFEEALAVSEEFGLSLNEARAVMQRLLMAGEKWISVARAVKASKADLEIMEPAFRLKMPTSAAKAHGMERTKDTR
jgi:serine/threonine-protein kinase HipA